MRTLIIRIVTNSLGLYVASQLIDGITYKGGLATLIITGTILGLVNFFIKPIITILSLPLILFTFGSFILVINTLLLLLASAIVPGFYVESLFAALLGVLVMFAINIFISWLVDTEKKQAP